MKMRLQIFLANLNSFLVHAKSPPKERARDLRILYRNENEIIRKPLGRFFFSTERMKFKFDGMTK
jgi:hypothetical protein